MFAFHVNNQEALKKKVPDTIIQKNGRGGENRRNFFFGTGTFLPKKNFWTRLFQIGFEKKIPYIIMKTKVGGGESPELFFGPELFSKKIEFLYQARLFLQKFTSNNYRMEGG